MTVVLRIAKRRTSWELTDVHTIVQTEFQLREGGIDLRPSVYVLDTGTFEEAVQTHTEHAASFLRSPPNGGVNANLDGLSVEAPTKDGPASTAKFEHARRTHHELVLEDENELRRVVTAFVQDAAARRIAVERRQLLDYANDRLDQNDLEWVRALAEEPGVGWSSKLQKRRAQRERDAT